MAKPGSDHVFLFSPVVIRRFLVAFFVTALVVVLIVGVIYRQDVRYQQEMFEQESQHVLDVQQEFLVFEFAAVQSDLLYMVNQDVLRRFVSSDASVRRQLEREYIYFARNKAIYDQIRCLDMAGQEIVRVNYRAGKAEVVPQDELQSKSSRNYFQKALTLKKGEVFVSPFDLNVEHGKIEQPIKPVIRFLTPVFDHSGRQRGFLVFNYLGSQLLSHLKKISAGFRGESMLVNSTGEFLQAPDPSHEWGWLLEHPHDFRKEFPTAWDQCKSLEGGKIRVGKGLFSWRRVSPGRRTATTSIAQTTAGGQPSPSSLMIVSYVPSSLAHSRKLPNQLMILSVGVLALAALLLFYWARSTEIRRYHEHRIAESESRLRQLSSALLSTQETERRNLSRDLHDQLGQQVTAICLDLRSLQKKDDRANPNPLLQRAIDQTDQLLKSLHKIATRVRPTVLDDLGLQEAIESFLWEYQQRTDVKVRSQLQVDRERIPAPVGENIYRIVQESLANVASHAQVDEAEVTIETEDGNLYMTVRDFGIGFEQDENQGSARLGILGMRERVELLDGEFSLKSTPGGGTRIDVSIPLGEDE